MSLFKAALEAIKATNTSEVTPLSTTVHQFDTAYRAVMAKATDRLDALMAGNIEGWWNVGDVMTTEGEQFTIVVDDNNKDITIKTQLDQYPAGCDKHLLLEVFGAYLRGWKGICPEGMSLSLVVKFGKTLSASEYFSRTKPNLFDKGE